MGQNLYKYNYEILFYYLLKLYCTILIETTKSNKTIFPINILSDYLDKYSHFV